MRSTLIQTLLTSLGRTNLIVKTTIPDVTQQSVDEQVMLAMEPILQMVDRQCTLRVNRYYLSPPTVAKLQITAYMTR